MANILVEMTLGWLKTCQMIHMCHSINIEGYSLLRKGKQETNEEGKKIFNVKDAYICSEIQITE